jgi:hypothetical protein
VVECDLYEPQTAGVAPWLTGHKRRSFPRCRFRFTVDRVADSGGVRLVSVRARGTRPGLKTAADLVFAGELGTGGRVKSLALYKAEYRVPVGSGVSVVRRDYNRQANEPFPVLNDVNVVPCDFPCLAMADMPGAGPVKDGIWKEFAASDVVDGDRRSRAVRQTIVFATEKVRFGEQYRVPVERSLNQDVYLKALHGQGNGVRLVFNPRHPWPVYGEGPRGRFWLVEE